MGWDEVATGFCVVFTRSSECMPTYYEITTPNFYIKDSSDTKFINDYMTNNNSNIQNPLTNEELINQLKSLDTYNKLIINVDQDNNKYKISIMLADNTLPMINSVKKYLIAINNKNKINNSTNNELPITVSLFLYSNQFDKIDRLVYIFSDIDVSNLYIYNLDLSYSKLINNVRDVLYLYSLITVFNGRINNINLFSVVDSKSPYIPLLSALLRTSSIQIDIYNNFDVYTNSNFDINLADFDYINYMDIFHNIDFVPESNGFRLYYNSDTLNLNNFKISNVNINFNIKIIGSIIITEAIKLTLINPLYLNLDIFNNTNSIRLMYLTFIMKIFDLYYKTNYNYYIIISNIDFNDDYYKFNINSIINFDKLKNRIQKISIDTCNINILQLQNLFSEFINSNIIFGKQFNYLELKNNSNLEKNSLLVDTLYNIIPNPNKYEIDLIINDNQNTYSFGELLKNKFSSNNVFLTYNINNDIYHVLNNSEVKLVYFSPSQALNQLEFVQLLQKYFGNDMINYVQLSKTEPIHLNINLYKLDKQYIYNLKSILFLINRRNELYLNQEISLNIILNFYRINITIDDLIYIFSIDISYLNIHTIDLSYTTCIKNVKDIYILYQIITSFSSIKNVILNNTIDANSLYGPLLVALIKKTKPSSNIIITNLAIINKPIYDNTEDLLINISDTNKLYNYIDIFKNLNYTNLDDTYIEYNSNDYNLNNITINSNNINFNIKIKITITFSDNMILYISDYKNINPYIDFNIFNDDDIYNIFNYLLISYDIYKNNFHIIINNYSFNDLVLKLFKNNLIYVKDTLISITLSNTDFTYNHLNNLFNIFIKSKTTFGSQFNTFQLKNNPLLEKNRQLIYLLYKILYSPINYNFNLIIFDKQNTPYFIASLINILSYTFTNISYLLDDILYTESAPEILPSEKINVPYYDDIVTTQSIIVKLDKSMYDKYLTYSNNYETSDVNNKIMCFTNKNGYKLCLNINANIIEGFNNINYKINNNCLLNMNGDQICIPDNMTIPATILLEPTSSYSSDSNKTTSSYSSDSNKTTSSYSSDSNKTTSSVEITKSSEQTTSIITKITDTIKSKLNIKCKCSMVNNNKKDLNCSCYKINKIETFINTEKGQKISKSVLLLIIVIIIIIILYKFKY